MLNPVRVSRNFDIVSRREFSGSIGQKANQYSCHNSVGEELWSRLGSRNWVG